MDFTIDVNWLNGDDQETLNWSREHTDIDRHIDYYRGNIHPFDLFEVPVEDQMKSNYDPLPKLNLLRRALGRLAAMKR